MVSCNAVLKSESKSELRQVSNSAQAQHFSSLELLLDLYMPEMALSSKFEIAGSFNSCYFSSGFYPEVIGILGVIKFLCQISRSADFICTCMCMGMGM